MIKEMALIAMGRHLPAFNPKYCYHIAWQFEEDGQQKPWEKIFPDAQKSLDAMIEIWNTPKTLIHMSISRRNA